MSWLKSRSIRAGPAAEQKRACAGSVSLEAILIFAAVVSFWILIFRSIVPYLSEAKEKAVESELGGECGKLASLIDALSTYGKGIYLDYAPFVSGDVFFCQNAVNFCGSREIVVAKALASGGSKQVSCRTRIAEWVNLKHGGGLLSCEKAIRMRIHSVNITFATYDEKGGTKRACE